MSRFIAFYLHVSRGYKFSTEMMIPKSVTWSVDYLGSDIYFQDEVKLLNGYGEDGSKYKGMLRPTGWIITSLSRLIIL